MRSLVFILVVLASACRPSGPPAPSGPVEPPDGERLYGRNCAVCHGAEGRGDGPSAAMNRPSNLLEPRIVAQPDTELGRVIREGRGRMPAWRHLRTDEIAAIVAFVRELQASDPPAE